MILFIFIGYLLNDFSYHKKIVLVKNAVRIETVQQIRVEELDSFLVFIYDIPGKK